MEAILPAPRGTKSCGNIRVLHRNLVLHADDFGMNAAVTDGILAGFREGLLTSTAILTNAPDCARAISQWKSLQLQLAQHNLPSLAARERLSDALSPFDLGIHLNLTQGRPLTADRYPAPLLDAAGRFPGVFGLARRLLISGRNFRAAIERELTAQIEVLLDHGIAPTHLNSHQYIDLFPVVAALTPELLRRYSIRVVRVPWERGLTQTTLFNHFDPIHKRPLNWCLGQIKRMFAFRYLIEMARRRVAHPTTYFGTSHAGQINSDVMRKFVTLAASGFTEIGMHPGRPILDKREPERLDGWHDPLADVRPGELSLLTSPDLVELLESQQIRLGRLAGIAPSASAAKAA